MNWWANKGTLRKEFKHPFDEYSKAYYQYRGHWQDEHLRNESLEMMKSIIDGRNGFGNCLAILAIVEVDSNNLACIIHALSLVQVQCLSRISGASKAEGVIAYCKAFATKQMCRN